VVLVNVVALAVFLSPVGVFVLLPLHVRGLLSQHSGVLPALICLFSSRVSCSSAR
jgi:hypothetical protein